MRYAFAVYFLLLQIISAVAMAAEDAPVTPIPDVEQEQVAQTVNVSATKDPEFKSYRSMLAGLDAFDAHHQLAPAALPQFVLRPQKAELGIQGVTLRIEGNDASIDVPLADDGTFSLPRNQLLAADEHADIILNKKKGLFRWRPDIRSPGVPENARRLGDLRLECEMLWAVEKDSLGFFRRNLIKTMTMGEPCQAAHARLEYPSPRKLAGVTLVWGDRRESLPSGWIKKNGNSFAPPLYDRSWPDDTIIEFNFAVQ